MKEIQKVVQKLSRGQESAAAAYEPVQKHKVTPRIPGWLNYDQTVAELLSPQCNINTLTHVVPDDGDGGF